MSSPSISRRQSKTAPAGDWSYRTLFESAGVGLAVMTAGGRLVDVNPCLCRMLGCSPEELLGHDLDAITHADDRARLARLFKGPGRRRRTESALEQRCLRADGTWLWVYVTVKIGRASW